VSCVLPILFGSSAWRYRTAKGSMEPATMHNRGGKKKTRMLGKNKKNKKKTNIFFFYVEHSKSTCVLAFSLSVNLQTYYTVLYCTVLYCTVLYCTALY